MYGDTRFSQDGRHVEFQQNFDYYYAQPYPSDRYYHRIDEHPSVACSSQTHKENGILLARKQREENHKIIDNFLREAEDSIENLKLPTAGKVGIKISEARKKLVEVFERIAKLERSRAELGEIQKDDEWSEKWQECTGIRENTTAILEDFDKNILSELVKSLATRKKKRDREARMRARQRRKKILAREKRARLHEEANARIREKRKIIEREKQIESLRKDADIVLSDVRGKRNDAKRCLSLLQELRNLRRVKVNVARARGEHLPIAADQAFDNIIGQLVEQWSCLDREYSIEEQGLKLMLKTDNDRKIDKQKSNIFDDWERALFGRTLGVSDSHGIFDVERLVATRHAWDKYLNFEGEGSRVPIGWVMPVPPSSAAWQKCLRRN